MAIRRILLGYDESEAARRAAEVAAEVARATGATITVLKVGQVTVGTGHGILPAVAEEAHWAIAETGRKLVAERGAAAEAVLRWGDPAKEILAAARELAVDLIVVGHGAEHRLRERILGSVADAAVHQAHCSVLVVK